ncbi:hypothetical protein M5689_009316 [Euphorbia peplus]|nr:hypothetical protein M5689_009316 [Euphorbia peplus]
MLCSVPTPKSSSNWLDRLWSSKGFPADDPVSTSPPPIPSSFSISQSDVQPPDTSTGDTEWYGVMTHVLSDLFNMGGQPTDIISKKRTARKQTNPKFWELECRRKEEYVSDKNSNAEECSPDEEEEKGKSSDSDKEEELKGYSRSEVTVIDTSFQVWKLDKLVFRRKNSWKVVDKKGKSWTSSATKKRKGPNLDSHIRNVPSNNKSKSKSTDFIIDGMKQQDQKQEEACKTSLDGDFQVPKKRIDLCRSPKKSKKNSSSVVLIKAIASSKKSRKNLPHNSQFKENSSKRMRLD